MGMLDYADAARNKLLEFLRNTPAGRLAREGWNPSGKTFAERMGELPAPFDASPEAIARDWDSATAFGPGSLGGGALRGAFLAKSIKPVGGGASKLTKFEKALERAQRNAALPKEKGGLGLPPDNTPMDRARAMGFADEGFHGSVYDIDAFKPARASTESFAGRGVYITDSAEDASRNYASIYGPDVNAKVMSALESRERGYSNRMLDALSRSGGKRLTPRQKEVVLGSTLNADNTGVVYPLMYRTKKLTNIDPGGESPWIEAAERYVPKRDEYVPTRNAKRWEKALNEFKEIGGDTGYLHDTGAMIEGAPAREIFKAIRKSPGELIDADGNFVSGGVAAGDFVKHFGVDAIRHSPNFGNPQLNIADSHTIVLNPNQIRSRFAAFDPKRKYENNLLAQILAAPVPQSNEREKP